MRGRIVRRPMGGARAGVRRRESGAVAAGCGSTFAAVAGGGLCDPNELSRAGCLAYRRALLGGWRHQQRSDQVGNTPRTARSRLGRRAGARAYALSMSAAKHGTASLAEPAPVPARVQTIAVDADEAGMRVDRFVEARFPGLSFSHIQRIIRKGELRVNGKRAQPKQRLEAGQAVRIPPLRLDQPRPPAGDAKVRDQTRDFLKSITLFEDADVLVLNKPMGLAVQGGSGTTRHLDGMLETLPDAPGQP